MSADEAERLCSLLILDGKLEGWLDQVAGVLHVEEGTSGAATEARKFNGLTEWVGSFEQVFLEVACQDADKRDDTTHQELAPTQMLSLAASLTASPAIAASSPATSVPSLRVPL